MLSKLRVDQGHMSSLKHKFEAPKLNTIRFSNHLHRWHTLKYLGDFDTQSSSFIFADMD